MMGVMASCFIKKLPRYFLPCFEPFGLSVQQKRKIDFQADGHSGQFWLAIETILATFDLQVTNHNTSYLV